MTYKFTMNIMGCTWSSITPCLCFDHHPTLTTFAGVRAVRPKVFPSLRSMILKFDMVATASYEIHGSFRHLGPANLLSHTLLHGQGEDW